MGKLDDALVGSGFPSAMPDVPKLTGPQEIACAARILAASDYALDVAGHITVMCPGDDGTMWCTPYGLWWRELSASDVLVLDADGQVIEGRWDVTPAVYIHTELHRARPDARVIIHNHPYYGSLMSTMRLLPEISDQQACMFDGDLALFDEYTGGIDEAIGGSYLARRIGDATAVVLANHGVLVTGETVPQAVFRASTFERTCRLNYEAQAVGQEPVPVPTEQRATLKAALNAPFTVGYYWGGQVRHLLRDERDVLE